MLVVPHISVAWFVAAVNRRSLGHFVEVAVHLKQTESRLIVPQLTVGLYDLMAGKSLVN